MSASDAEAAAAVSGAGLMPRSVLDKMAAIQTTEIISHAVWLYDVFGLSLRDVELDLAERGVVVTPETIRQWCKKFGFQFTKRLSRRPPRPGDTFRHLDELSSASAAGCITFGARWMSAVSC